jgi:hypothetical protein
MPCCGSNRRSLAMPQPTESPPVPSPRLLETAPPVLFEYLGRTGLTATGPFTGRRYRFDGSGAQVEVDARDAPSLAAVPNLRPCRH